MKTWIEPEPMNIPSEILMAASGQRLLAEILLGRGFSQVESITQFLDPDRYSETPPDELPGIEQAVDRLNQALKNGEVIMVWGDYDVDGQTATTLLVEFLRSMGAKVSYHIPVRARERHGIQMDALAKYLKRDMRVLLTCDTGISEVESIASVRQSGLDVIITDHHNLPAQLPPANVILNPKLLHAGHSLSELSGVGVAYKLIQAIKMSSGDLSTREPGFDLVALGTIADLAMLVDDNRYLVQRGISQLAENKRCGLQAVYQLASIPPADMNEEIIGYNLAPRLNAVGRLADANRMVELFITDDPFKAEIIANEIEGLNAKRKLLTDQVLQAVLEQVEHNRSLLDQSCLVLSHPTWPGGILGIVASSLVETYNRPVVLLATPPGEPARGSARSVPGIDITTALETNREFLLAFGGHPMAAGLSLDPAKLAEFQNALSRTISQLTGREAFKETLTLDAVLPLTSLPDNLMDILKSLSPFGPGNPSLNLLARSVTIQSSRTFGRNRNHLKIKVTDEKGKIAEVTWWRSASQPLPEGIFDLAYTLKPVNYLGQPELQITWVAAREHAEIIDLRPEKRPLIIHDHRQEDDPRIDLKSLVDIQNTTVWREGEEIEKVDGFNRFELKPADTLIIWSIPPSHDILSKVMNLVKPRKLHLYAMDPGSTNLEAFQLRLAGMVKYALKHKTGKASLHELATAMAQQLETIEAGLDWLEARGDIQYKNLNGLMEISAGGIAQPDNIERTLNNLRERLAETAAFRNYYLRADKHSLFE